MLIFAIKYENIFIEKQINNLVKKILSEHATLPDNMKPVIRGVLKSINKNKKKSTSSQSNNDFPDSEEFPPEFLELINSRKSKTTTTPKEEPAKVPEID